MWSVRKVINSLRKMPNQNLFSMLFLCHQSSQKPGSNSMHLNIYVVCRPKETLPVRVSITYWVFKIFYYIKKRWKGVNFWSYTPSVSHFTSDFYNYSVTCDSNMGYGARPHGFSTHGWMTTCKLLMLPVPQFLHL